MVKRITAFFMSVLFSLAVSAPSFASVATPSNAQVEIPALMSASESISTYSSTLPLIDSTIDLSKVRVGLEGTDENGFESFYRASVDSNGRFSAIPRDADIIPRNMYVSLSKDSLPAPGVYKLTVQVFLDGGPAVWGSPYMWWVRSDTNTNDLTGSVFSGLSLLQNYDWQVSALVDVSLVSRLDIGVYFDSSDTVWPLGGYIRVRWERYTGDGDVTIGGSVSSENTQLAISDSSSQTAENTSRIADAIENLASDFAASMEPHYDNILTQLHHITEQLHAFWNQLAAMYNDTILPHMTAQTDRIVTAIENIDLTFEVHMDELIENDNRLHDQQIENDNYHAEQIVEGYDNSGLESDNDRLGSQLDEYAAAEKDVMDSVNDSLEDFSFDADLDEYSSTIKLISDFMQDLYESSGGFKIVINLSVILSIASIVIGMYRFREG